MEDHGVVTAAQRAGHSLLAVHRGKSEIAAFFAEAATMTVHEFTVHEVLGSPTSGTVVVVDTAKHLDARRGVDTTV
jgi:hypothetical protein